MSTTSTSSRTRSIQKPASKDVSAQGKSRNEPRSGSPSRLPMRPPTRPTRSSTIAASSTSTSRVRGPTTIPSRQSSVSFAKPPPRPAENAAPPTTKPLTRASSIRQLSSTATASSTTVNRSVSAARPNSSSETRPTAALKERQSGHFRAKSSVTSLTAVTTLRPSSQVTAPSRSNPSPASSTSSASTSARTRRTRTNSQSQSSTTTTAPLATRRPAFSTNQQHYSPAKSLAPKPLTSTFLAPPSPSKQPVNIALTAETSRLQTELLQLSLLHREAHATSTSWHESARSKLKTRFEEAAAADQALRTIEQDAAEARGLQDLLSWDTTPKPSTPKANSAKKGKGELEDEDTDKKEKLPLDEKVRLLDQVLNGVWALSEPNSRYQRAVHAFEDWARQAAEIRTAQRSGDVDALLARKPGEKGAGIFVGDLDAGAWKRDHAGLLRMLEGWRGTLAQLGAGIDDDGDGTPLSGLARALRGCRCLVRDMLAELEVMGLIERDALAAEAEWMDDVSARVSESRRDVPPWKLLGV